MRAARREHRRTGRPWSAGAARRPSTSRRDGHSAAPGPWHFRCGSVSTGAVVRAGGPHEGWYIYAQETAAGVDAQRVGAPEARHCACLQRDECARGLDVLELERRGGAARVGGGIRGGAAGEEGARGPGTVPDGAGRRVSEWLARGGSRAARQAPCPRDHGLTRRRDSHDRTVRIGLKRGKLLHLFTHPARDAPRDKHRNVLRRARFLKQRLESAGFRLVPWDFKKGQPPRFWAAHARPMDDDDDDLYGPTAAPAPDAADDSADEPMEEESAADDDSADSADSDSDLEIIIDKPAAAPKPAQQQQPPHESRAIKIEAPPQASTAPSQAARTTPPQAPAQPGTAYPAIRSSTVDVNADPVYPPVGKPISRVVMDADLAEETKPWRLPGADQSDFFNYGFDEFTWEQYRLKQQEMTETIADQKAHQQQMVAMMSGLPGPGAPAPTAPAGMPGMPGEAEMMQMMQQMVASGMDPNSMDFNQMMMQMSNGGGMGGFGGPSGNQGAFGGGHGGGGGGGGGGRGRGRGRGNW